MPDWVALVRTRVRSTGTPLDDDVIDEIAEHAEQMFQAAIIAGHTPEQARTAVEREMEDLAALARAARRRRRRLPPAPEPPPAGRPRPLITFARDLRHGVRLLAARPVFAAAAIVTLALGIGANTAIFSVIHSLLLEPLPYQNPSRLVMLWEANADNPADAYIVSAPNWKDWREQSTTLEEFAIWEPVTFNIADGAEPVQVPGLRASASLFPLLGARPQLGRTFTAAEEAPGHDIAVIADSLWRGQFGARSDIIGRRVRMNRREYEIVGVMPPEFQFPQRRVGIWVPIAFNEEDAGRGSHSFRAAARLKEHVTFDAARAEIDALGRRLATQYRENRGETATITRMDELGVANLKPTLTALSVAVALVLLIACVNVANLLVAQATGRQREFAIRAALGAGRRRLASQLLAEGLVLAVIGGTAGVFVAWAATAALADSLPGSIRYAPFRDTGGVPLDPVVLAFTCAIALVTGVLFSLAPIAGIARGTAESLRAASTRGTSARFTAVRSTLLAVEVALAVIVLAGAGLMIKSITRLTSVDPGLDPRHVLLMDIALPQTDFYGPPERTTFCLDVQREVGSLPGVHAVGAMSHLPLDGGSAGRGFAIEGRAPTAPNEGASASYRLTCPGYFASLGIPIVRGRDFSAADTTTSPGVLIINEETATRYWPGQDPVGQRVKGGGYDSPSPWVTIIGVVGNVRHFGLDAAARREIYRPYSQAAWPVMTVTVKTATQPLTMAPAVRAALARIDPEQPVSRVRTMEQVIADSMGGRRFPTLLLSLFSAVALILAGVGVYGVVNYVVSQRTREMGIRVALGARGGQVVRLIVGRSMIPIGLGIAAGIAGAIASSRLLSTLLFEVAPADPVVLASIAGLLAFTAIAAAWLPARRAASVDPLRVLRDE
jgi:putative ABC transport system permease protein